MPIWRIISISDEGELGRDLVSGDAQRVEASRHVACFEDDHVVPQPAQLVGTREPGRARADHGHAFAGRRARLEEPARLVPTRRRRRIAEAGRSGPALS